MMKKFTLLTFAIAVLGLFISSTTMAQLSGNYTIGAGGNYATFNAAVSALTSNGVSGPVTFTVASGTYTDRVVIGSISGASATNTITFDGVDTSTRTLSYNAASGPATLVLNGAKYIKFKNLRITSTGTSGQIMCVYIGSNSQYNTFEGCAMNMATYYNYPYPITVLSSGSETSYSTTASNVKFNSFIDCNIRGGYYNVVLWGAGSTNYSCEGFLFDKCIFSYTTYMHNYFYYQNNFTITNCKYLGSQYVYGMNIYLYYTNGANIQNNEFKKGSYGIYAYYHNYYNTSNSSKIINNMISLEYSYVYAMYLNYIYNTEIYHNTVWSRSTSSSGYYYASMYLYRPYYCKVKNNLLVNSMNPAIAIYYDTWTNTNDLDYNNYYSYSGDLGFYNGSYYSTLAAFQSGLPSQNQNSTNDLPHISDPTDLHYSSGTVPVFAPYISSVPLDIDGDTRKTVLTMVGADEHAFPPYDVDILKILTPVVPNFGNNTISVQLVNAGENSLPAQNIYLEYSINNGNPVTQTFAATAWPSFTKKTFTFTTPWNITANGYYDVKVKMTQQITGDPDATDQIMQQMCTGLAGNYTIAKSGGDFSSFSDAVAAIFQCGLAGAITFDVKNGTYFEQVTIPEILGTSATSTITFKGESKTGVQLVWGGGNAYNDPMNPTLALNGADYLVFEDMTVLSNGTGSYGMAVQYCNASDHNTFRNVHMEVTSTVMSSYLTVLCASGQLGYNSSTGNNANYALIEDCTIKGGYYAVRWNGASYGTPNYNSFINNTISDFIYYGFYDYYNNGTLIKGNKILGNRMYNNQYWYSYGLYSYFCAGETIVENTIEAGRYGLYLYYHNYYTQANYPSICASNIIQNLRSPDYQTGLALYYYTYYTKVYNNSVWVSGNYANYQYYSAFLSMYPYYGTEVKNNIFVSSNTNLIASIYYPYFIDIDYNDYVWKSTSTAGRYYIYPNGNYYTTFNSFKNHTTQIGTHDQNSFDGVDPQFISKTNLHLTEGAEGIISGANTPYLYDVDGDPRCLLVTYIGADEPKWEVDAVDFVADDTMCLYTPLTFFNTGDENAPHQTSWYLNGGFETNDFHFTHSFQQPGKDTVMLEMMTCAGVDSATRYVVIEAPTVAPSGEFMASKNIVETGEEVGLFDLSINCPTGWTWEISPAQVNDPFTGNLMDAYEYVNGTDKNSRNPELIFNYTGAFDVCLTPSNLIGTGQKVCKVGYINVKFSDNMCGNYTSTSYPYGSLYDDGGLGKHGKNTFCTYLLKPCGDDVEITFINFNLAPDAYLRLYDGSSNMGTPMWDVNKYGPEGIRGNMSDAGFDTTLVASQTGMVFIEFETGDQDANGFKLEWKNLGVGSYLPPVAGFDVADTGCIVYSMMYENTSIADFKATYFSWDYDGNGTIDDHSVDGEFSTSFPGLQAKYKTVLYAETCGGIDTFDKEIVLINPVTKLQGDFFANITAPVVNQDVVEFTNDYYRLSCVNSWEWKITPSSFYFVDETDKNSAKPHVIFLDTVCYNVTLVMGNTNVPNNKTVVSKTCYIHPKEYCSPVVMNLHSDIGLSRVKIGTIDNMSSVGVKGYNNFTNNHATDLVMDQEYEIILERNTNFNPIDYKVYIDYNIDGDFTDPGEMVASANNFTSNHFVDTIKVPTNATLGATAMRVSANYAGYTINPCGPNAFGEIEDYRIYITPDKTAPVIILNGNNPMYLEKGHEYVEDSAYVWDNIQGVISDSVIITNFVDIHTVGSYYVNYDACDTVGNCATTVKRVVHITADMTAPTITLFGSNPDYADVNRSYVEPGYEALDLGDGDITSLVVESSNIDVNTLGTYTKTYTITDSKGYTAVATRTVIVTDGAAPDITLVGDNPMYLEIGTPYVEPGYSVVDNYWPLNKINHDVTGLVNENKAGTYKIFYSASDFSGNGPVIVEREVIVWDSNAPTLIAKGGDVIEVEVFNKFIDPGLEIIDQAKEGFTIKRYGTFLSNFPNEIPTIIGNYILFYEVTDPSGNKSEILGRVVKVVDTEAPEVTLNGSPYMIIKRWDDWSNMNPGYTVTDNYYDNAELTIKEKDLVNVHYQGLYTVTITAKDPSGNTSPDIIRLVRVTYDETSDIEETTNGIVSVYPNPSNGKYNINLDLPSNENVTISVVNLLGERILDVENGNIAKSNYVIDLSNQAQGVYMLKVQTSNNTYLTRLVLTK